MYVETLSLEITSKFHKSKRALVLKCDSCSEKFQRRYVKIWIEKEFHFCSNECKKDARKPGGVQYDAVLEKQKITSIKRFGTDFPWQNEEIIERRKDVWVGAFGVDNPLKCPKIREKSRQTLQENWGVDSPMQSSEIRQKQRQSMIDSGINGLPRSKGELKLENLLKEKFQNVQTQVFISGWWIDFYVDDIDTFIQFDGVYWHGLDRPIEKIRESDGAQNKSIAQNWFNDRKQDAAFRAKGLRLVRITDSNLENDFDLAKYV